MRKILILGLGNPLLKDDGVGPEVIGHLKQMGKLPDGVEAVEAAGSYFNYWDKLIQCRYVIAVDSITGGGPPGSIYLLGPEQITRWNQSAEISHELHFIDAYNMSAKLGVSPELIIVGIEPQEIGFSMEPSPAIKKKVPLIASIVQNQVAKLLSTVNNYEVNNE